MTPRESLPSSSPLRPRLTRESTTSSYVHPMTTGASPIGHSHDAHNAPTPATGVREGNRGNRLVFTLDPCGLYDVMDSQDLPKVFLLAALLDPAMDPRINTICDPLMTDPRNTPTEDQIRQWGKILDSTRVPFYLHEFIVYTHAMEAWEACGVRCKLNITELRDRKLQALRDPSTAIIDETDVEIVDPNLAYKVFTVEDIGEDEAYLMRPQMPEEIMNAREPKQVTVEKLNKMVEQVECMSESKAVAQCASRKDPQDVGTEAMEAKVTRLLKEVAKLDSDTNVLNPWKLVERLNAGVPIAELLPTPELARQSQLGADQIRELELVYGRSE